VEGSKKKGELTAVGEKKETPIIGDIGTDPITECGFRGKTDEYVRDKRCLTSIACCQG